MYLALVLGFGFCVSTFQPLLEQVYVWHMLRWPNLVLCKLLAGASVRVAHAALANSCALQAVCWRKCMCGTGCVGQILCFASCLLVQV